MDSSGPVYERDSVEEAEIVAEWENGIGWKAHPREEAERVSYAVEHDGDVYLLDPLDATGIRDEIGQLGEVAGVAVLSNYHARDAGKLAREYDVPVHVPDWFDDYSVDTETVPVDEIAGFELRQADLVPGLQDVLPVNGWRETVAWREEDGTLYTPDLVSRKNAAGDEDVGFYLLTRLDPPSELFQDIRPDRILSGHGEPVVEDATGALDAALDGADDNLIGAALENGSYRAAAFWKAFRE